MRHAFPLLLTLVTTLLRGPIATASAEDYLIKLVRPAKVGERYGIVAPGHAGAAYDDHRCRAGFAPEWRSLATYTVREVEQLISDPRIPVERRVQYALRRSEA